MNLEYFDQQNGIHYEGNIDRFSTVSVATPQPLDRKR